MKLSHKKPVTESQWTNEWYDTDSTGGRFVRTEALYRNWITTDGKPGPTGRGGFKAESKRYHLFVSWACPWAHRTLILRTLKDLKNHITVSYSRPYMGPDSWSFEPEQGRLFSGNEKQDEYIEYLYELYRLIDPEYDTRATVPVLWDKQQQTIVSNESADIVRMFNSHFQEVGANERDFCPAHLREDIDNYNEKLYSTVNNGVYRAGFATTQEAYEEAVITLFETLDWLEEHLSTRRYLTGHDFTEADIRLFPTLVRFDSVYATHFKCGLKRIVDYPNLWGYTRDIYQMPGIAETVNIEENKIHYFTSHDTINPAGIIPIGPELDFTAPHDRNSL